MSNLFLIREAVASVALEHPRDHDCRTCRAAHGDAAALAEILFELQVADNRRNHSARMYRAAVDILDIGSPAEEPPE